MSENVITQIKLNETTYDISPSWENIQNKPNITETESVLFDSERGDKLLVPWSEGDEIDDTPKANEYLYLFDSRYSNHVKTGLMGHAYNKDNGKQYKIKLDFSDCFESEANDENFTQQFLFQIQYNDSDNPRSLESRTIKAKNQDFNYIHEYIYTIDDDFHKDTAKLYFRLRFSNMSDKKLAFIAKNIKIKITSPSFNMSLYIPEIIELLEKEYNLDQIKKTKNPNLQTVFSDSIITPQEVISDVNEQE